MNFRTVQRLSPSSINLFYKDYKQWYKQYILGEKQDNNIYFEFGTAFHGLLEDFFQADYEKYDSVLDYAMTEYDKAFKKWFEDNETLQSFFTEEINMKTCQDWTFGYIQQWVTETKPLVARYGKKGITYNRPDLCEEHLECKELKVHGYADAYRGKDNWNKNSGFLNFHTIEDIDPEEFGGLITDYKTSKLTRNTNSTAYFLQCAIYALIYSKLNKRKKQAFVCVDYIKYGKKFFYHIDDKVLETTEKLINDTWLLIDIINENPEEYSDSKPKL